MRTEKISTLNEIRLHMYSSKETGDTLKPIREKHNISIDSNFVDIIGDIILGFYPKSSLPTLLMQEIGISKEEADSTASELASFLKPIEDMPSTSQETDEKNPIKEPLDLRRESVPKQYVDMEENLHAHMNILTRDELMKSLATHHTMASDTADLRKEQSEPKPKNAGVSVSPIVPPVTSSIVEEATPPPVHGYEAYRSNEETSKD